MFIGEKGFLRSWQIKRVTPLQKPYAEPSVPSTGEKKTDFH